MPTLSARLLLASLLLSLAACGGGGGGGGGTTDGGEEPTPPTPPTPVAIYQVDADSGPGIAGIYRPDDGIIDGNVAATSTIGGVANAGFEQAFGVHHDSRGDTMIIGCLNIAAILFFDGVAALDGDVGPTRFLGGASTLITLNNAYETYVDETRDLLYVAYLDGVLVFENAATINGDVAPVRHITGGNTGLVTGNRDKRLFIDETNDRLYVAEGDSASVLVWDNASTVDGDTAPNRTVAGNNTGFNFPWGIAVDVARDILYVADESANSIFVFDGAAALTGNVAPSRTITGATSTVEGPAGIDVDPELDRLYVSHFPTAGAAIGIWDNASTVNGDVAPTRSLGGNNTPIDSTADVDVSR